MGWTASLFGGGRNVDSETEGNNFGFGGRAAAGGQDVLLEDLEEDRTDLLRIILYGAFFSWKVLSLRSCWCARGIFRIHQLGFGETSGSYTEITIPRVRVAGNVCA